MNVFQWYDSLVTVCQPPSQRDSSGVRLTENSPLPLFTNTVTCTEQTDTSNRSMDPSQRPSDQA